MRTRGEKIFNVCNLVFLSCMCLITLYPLVHVASIAFSSYAESIRIGLHIFPLEIDMTSIKKVVTAPEIHTAFLNTLWRTGVGTFLSVLTTGMGAYALSKPTLPLRRFVMVVMLVAMYFNGGTIPTFLLMKSLNLLNNRWAMVLPSLVWGFNLIVMRNFFLSIPDSLEESARIDGAGDLRTFFVIVVPLSTPVIATIAMWMGVHHWNAYMDNLLYVTDRSLYVLQRIIRSLVLDASMSGLESMNESSVINPESLKAATIIVATVPILLIYPFAQKYFIKGVMVGAVKG